MIDITIYTNKKEYIVGLKLEGHASEYDGDTTSKICFAVSMLTNACELIDKKGIVINQKGLFQYMPHISTRTEPLRIEEKRFTILEFLVIALTTLTTKYYKSFNIRRENILWN